MSTSEDDWTMHRRALALQHGAPGLGYFDAVKRAGAEHKAAAKRANFRERATVSPDHALDEQATALQETQGLSYWEALQLAAGMPGAARNFAEPGSAAATIEGQPIEIFKAGRQIDDAGTVHEFTPADVAEIAQAYDPALREAPLTIGHPESNRPAYGWVSRLQATADGRLMMKADRVDMNFAEMVKAGRYVKRSASFYPPAHPNNPRPGAWYLRHVAWLGAQQPAVPGLRNVTFGDRPDGCSAFALD